MVLLLLFNFLIAIIYILNKKLCLVVSPLLLSGIRFLIAGFFFYGIQPVTRRVFITYLRTEWKNTLAIIIGFIGGDVLRTQALQVIPSSHASLLATTAPFIALFTSYFMLHEPITYRKMGGLLIGVMGLLPLLSKKINGSVAPGDFISAYTLFIISLFLFVIGGIYSKKVSSKGYHLFTILAAVMSGSGIVGCGGAFITGKVTWNGYYALLDHWFFVVCLIFIQNIIGFYLYNYLVKHNPVTLVTFSNLLIPLFTSIILWWFTIETLDNEFFFAFGMLTLAFIIFMFPTTKKN